MHADTGLEERPAPGLDVFAAAMRSVLRTRHDSPGDGPEALEERTPAGGYVWRWSTDAGLWRVTVGEVADPRPLLHGPGGIWRVAAEPGEHAAGLALVMLRAAGAVPPAAPVDPGRRYMPCCFADLAEAETRGRDLVCAACGTPFLPPITGRAEHLPTQAELLAAATPPHLATTGPYVEDHRLEQQHPRLVPVRPTTAVVRGERTAAAPATVEPLRAVLYRPSDPRPEVPAGYLPVPTTSDQPTEDGRWEVQMPDGWRRYYDPARQVLMPYETTSGGTALLLFAADQRPGHLYPARPAPPAYNPPDLANRGVA